MLFLLKSLWWSQNKFAKLMCFIAVFGNWIEMLKMAIKLYCCLRQLKLKCQGFSNIWLPFLATFFEMSFSAIDWTAIHLYKSYDHLHTKNLMQIAHYNTFHFLRYVHLIYAKSLFTNIAAETIESIKKYRYLNFKIFKFLS